MPTQPRHNKLYGACGTGKDGSLKGRGVVWGTSSLHLSRRGPLGKDFFSGEGVGHPAPFVGPPWGLVRVMPRKEEGLVPNS